jgi:hypothetical protein
VSICCGFNKIQEAGIDVIKSEHIEKEGEVKGNKT